MEDPDRRYGQLDRVGGHRDDGCNEQPILNAPTAYLWASSNQVHFTLGRTFLATADGRAFKPAVCLFKRDGARLRMRCSRLAPFVFEILLQGAGPWRAHVNLHDASDEVALLPTAAEDTAGCEAPYHRGTCCWAPAHLRAPESRPPAL